MIKIFIIIIYKKLFNIQNTKKIGNNLKLFPKNSTDILYHKFTKKSRGCSCFFTIFKNFYFSSHKL